MTIERAKELMVKYTTINSDSIEYKYKMEEIISEYKYIVICYCPIHERTFLWVDLTYEESEQIIGAFKKQGCITRKTKQYSVYINNKKPYYEIGNDFTRELIDNGGNKYEN
jgi:hypothetical protein